MIPAKTYIGVQFMLMRNEICIFFSQIVGTSWINWLLRSEKIVNRMNVHWIDITGLIIEIFLAIPVFMQEYFFLEISFLSILSPFLSFLYFWSAKGGSYHFSTEHLLTNKSHHQRKYFPWKVTGRNIHEKTYLLQHFFERC